MSEASEYQKFLSLYKEGRYDDCLRVVVENRRLFRSDELENMAKAFHNASIFFQLEARNIDKAVQFSEAAHAIAPTHPEITMQLCYMRLCKGDFDAAWSPAAWSALFQQANDVNWRGGASEHLVVRNNNGLGDLIQFLRFMPAARRRVRRMSLQIPSGSRALLETSPLLDGVNLLETGTAVACTAAVEMMVLPAALGAGRSDATAAPQPTFNLPERRVEKWRDLIADMAGGRKTVGLVWGGGAGRSRNLPLSALTPLTDDRNIRFFALTNMQDKAELFSERPRENLSDLGIFDLLNAACIMRALDVVIAPDVGFAHLAAAVGAKTCVALSTASEWRWGIDAETTPWHPTMRLFRQKTKGNWGDVTTALQAALQTDL